MANLLEIIVSKRMKMHISLDSAIPRVRLYPQETNQHKGA